MCGKLKHQFRYSFVLFCRILCPTAGNAISTRWTKLVRISSGTAFLVHSHHPVISRPAKIIISSLIEVCFDASKSCWNRGVDRASEPIFFRTNHRVLSNNGRCMEMARRGSGAKAWVGVPRHSLARWSRCRSSPPIQTPFLCPLANAWFSPARNSRMVVLPQMTNHQEESAFHSNTLTATLEVESSDTSLPPLINAWFSPATRRWSYSLGLIQRPEGVNSPFQPPFQILTRDNHVGARVIRRHWYWWWTSRQRFKTRRVFPSSAPLLFTMDFSSCIKYLGFVKSYYIIISCPTLNTILFFSLLM